MTTVMTGFSRPHWLSWNQKDFWFQLRYRLISLGSCLTFLNAPLIRMIASFAGVEGVKCDITGALNENTPICRRGIFRAESSYKNVVIPIVAQSIINFNSYARYYV